VPGTGGAPGTGGFNIPTGGSPATGGAPGGCNPSLCSGVFACCTLGGNCGNGVPPFCF
jgi:hypothetical protein